MIDWVTVKITPEQEEEMKKRFTRLGVDLGSVPSDTVPWNPDEARRLTALFNAAPTKKRETPPEHPQS
jgi:hypothetical protein